MACNHILAPVNLAFAPYPTSKNFLSVRPLYQFMSSWIEILSLYLIYSPGATPPIPPIRFPRNVPFMTLFLSCPSYDMFLTRFVLPYTEHDNKYLDNNPIFVYSQCICNFSRVLTGSKNSNLMVTSFGKKQNFIS